MKTDEAEPMAQTIAVELDDYRWLIGPEVRGWLEAAAGSSDPSAAEVARLRRHLSPERAAHLVLEQAALRIKARAKFAAAERMFFTPRRWSRPPTRSWPRSKARRFDGRALDLCAGIGGDLIALAARGEAIGIDRDPLTALLATANLRAAAERGLPPGTNTARPSNDVRVADACQVDLSECDAWHIDPDRRPPGKRTTHVAASEPSADAIEQLLVQNPHAAIKLAPAADVPPDWAERAELEWISRGRECRQLVAWFGHLAGEPGRRRASVLADDRATPRSIVGRADEPLGVAPAIGRICTSRMPPCWPRA